MKQHAQAKSETEKRSIHPGFWIGGGILVLLLIGVFSSSQSTKEPREQPKLQGTVSSIGTVSKTNFTILSKEKARSSSRRIRNRHHEAILWCDYRMGQINRWFPTYWYFRGQKHLIQVGKAKKEVIVEFSNNYHSLRKSGKWKKKELN